MALIDESTVDKPRGRLSCFHFNFYPLGGWVPFRGQMAGSGALSLSYRVPSLSSFLSDAVRQGRARWAMVGGEIEMIEHVNVWFGLYQRACNVVNESVCFSRA